VLSIYPLSLIQTTILVVAHYGKSAFIRSPDQVHRLSSDHIFPIGLKSHRTTHIAAVCYAKMSRYNAGTVKAGI